MEIKIEESELIYFKSKGGDAGASRKTSILLKQRGVQGSWPLFLDLVLLSVHSWVYDLFFISLLCCKVCGVRRYQNRR